MQSDKNSLEEDVILTEICSKSNKKIQYVKLKGILESVNVNVTNITSWSYFQGLQSLIKDIFLPKGYPNSVSNDYLEYQLWDTCQAFCSSISGTLTMRAVMQGIGVGSEAATPVSAAVTWIMKDGTGMIGSIMFAWFKGSKLDSDCKKWRLFADILNDIAMFIELYIPYLINYSLYMLCVATAFKALVGTAGSSTRAALVTHQAIKGNIADVSAKDGSQEIFINLFALLFGILLLKNVTETDQIWTVMCTSTMFHLIFNYKAVKCLKMNVFNAERFRLALRLYLPTSEMPSVEQVNKREAVFLGMGTSDRAFCGFSIAFGSNLQNAVKSKKVTAFQLSAIAKIFQDKNYFILVCNKKKKIYVSFHNTFKEIDVLKAYFHSYILGIALNYLQKGEILLITKRTRKDSPLNRLINILHEVEPISSPESAEELNAILLKAYMICLNFIDEEFSAFYDSCVGQGWNLNKHLINVDDWRAEWKCESKISHQEFSLKKMTVNWLYMKYFIYMFHS